MDLEEIYGKFRGKGDSFAKRIRARCLRAAYVYSTVLSGENKVISAQNKRHTQ